MTKKERQQAFERHLTEIGSIPEGWKVAKGFGASNSFTVTDAGIELIDADISQVPPACYPGYVFLSSVGIPPGNQLFVAVYVHSGAQVLTDRLVAMAAGASGLNARTNNNVAILAASDGRLYLRNKGHWVDSPTNPDLMDFQPGIEVDRVDFAIYPQTRKALSNLLTQEFVGDLAARFGKGKLHEVRPWPTEFDVRPTMRRLPKNVLFSEIDDSIRRLGGFYPGKVLQRFHVALNHLDRKHFVLLKGLSGTGKTTLAVQYSKAIHGLSAHDDDPFLFVCSVRSDWTDPTGLTGYLDSLSGRYIVPQFLEATLTATAYSDVPVFVCIDEINIAPVEYYFSGVLSSMENSSIDLDLHSNRVALEGDNGESIPGHVPWPPNLYLVGTLNTDETTHSVSDKVLDRAVVIEMPAVDTAAYLGQLVAQDGELGPSVRECRAILEKLNEALTPHALGFGYRVIREFICYHAFAIRSGSLSSSDAIDFQIADKILVKLRGSERQRKMLVQLTEIVGSYPVALSGVNSLIKQLSEYQAFQWSN